MRETVTVGLGERSYDIHVGPGLLAEAGALLGPWARGRIAIVSDTHVAQLYQEGFKAVLAARGMEVGTVTVPVGESSKSFVRLESLCASLLEMNVDRSGLIVALGGGVVGDLTGFAAGILKRGVAFVQIPTTLLAQVDSSVGGKTAINTSQGKNLVGLFHQPKIVIADTDVLKTLPKRELFAGYAEVAKYGALGDRTFFEWLETNGSRALAGDSDAMVHAVAHSCRMKADIVSRDERETGERALLNLGHTFGHALEATTGYSDRLLHGEAVAIGMALAFRLSVALGLCPGHDSERFIRHLQAAGLPSSIADVPGPRPSPDELIGHMAHDKKARDGRINFVLVHGIGQAFVTNEVPGDALRAVLA